MGGIHSLKNKEKQVGGRDRVRTCDPLLANSKSEFGWREEE
jgi:hypothetical protein